VTRLGGKTLPKTTLFIGSSAAAKSQAKAVVQHFTSTTLKFLPWWEAFTPGKTLLEDLDTIRGRVNGAILLFSPEATSKVRGKAVGIPNLNVLFEFGYFYGHFGKKNVSIIKYGEYYLPSDFGGYIHISGSSFFKRGAVTKVGKRTEGEFTRWIENL
jgi:predicted nucleotide-binding protein